MFEQRVSAKDIKKKKVPRVWELNARVNAKWDGDGQHNSGANNKSDYAAGIFLDFVSPAPRTVLPHGVCGASPHVRSAKRNRIGCHS